MIVILLHQKLNKLAFDQFWKKHRVFDKKITLLTLNFIHLNFLKPKLKFDKLRQSFNNKNPTGITQNYHYASPTSQKLKSLHVFSTILQLFINANLILLTGHKMDDEYLGVCYSKTCPQINHYLDKRNSYLDWKICHYKVKK